MKKILSILLIGLFICSIMPLALAEDISTVSNTELEQQITEMSTPETAKYRLDQLALSLESQIEHAKDITTELNATSDTTIKLEGYIAELEVLLDRVKNINPSSTPIQMAAEFLSIKIDAITISQNFRTTIQSVASTEKIKDITNKTQEMKSLREAELKSQLEASKETMYTTTMKNLLLAQGLTDPAITEKIQNSDVTSEELKNLIKNVVSNLSSDKRSEFKTLISQSKNDIKSSMEAKKTEIKAEMKAKSAEIKAQKQAEKAQKQADIAAKRTQRASEQATKKAELQSKLDARNAKIASKTTKSTQ